MHKYLKDCNIKLYNLRTEEHCFVAWIIYSTNWNCFIAGVDCFFNDEAKSQKTIKARANSQAAEAILRIDESISQWQKAGRVPVSDLLSQIEQVLGYTDLNWPRGFSLGETATSPEGSTT